MEFEEEENLFESDKNFKEGRIKEILI